MNRDLYSNIEFTDIKKRLNQEIQRRGSFKWWDPLTTPSVGEDKSSPLSLPDIGERILVDEKTYTINNPSEGSIEPTKNIPYPARGDNPGGSEASDDNGVPNTSAGNFSVDEIKNFLVGLSKIQDINLFYGRDEIEHLAFRDPKGIEDALVAAEKSELNRLLKDCVPYTFMLENNHLRVEYKTLTPPDLKIDEEGHLIFIPSDSNVVDDVLASFSFEIEEGDLELVIPDGLNINLKNDPNGGLVNMRHPDYPVRFTVGYPTEDGDFVMPSGELDGEEAMIHEGLSENNFFDDYGAEPGDGNYHPFNPFITPEVHRDWDDHDNDRNLKKTVVIEGGIPSASYGQNPRNPNPGQPYRSRPVYGGVIGSCNVACTGLCYKTCDNQCSESCSTTCWSRCGNACTASCGNVCTGCSTMCYTSCKTKCENTSGYACLKAGAKTVKIYTTGGQNGEFPANHIEATYYTCQSCSYTCQFYPNKKTTCWDADCMSKCFTSCNTACSTSCFGGCIDNPSENSGDYKTGKGRGCSAGCTINCIGLCQGVCEGLCVNTCWHACKQSCSDNCTWRCTTNCGSGCDQGCKHNCFTGCMNETNSTACTNCDTNCTQFCQHDCNKNCIGWGCRSICGIDNAGACEANCRINCMSTSCTSLCEDACSGQCSSCINTCGWQCGPCTSNCSAGCSAECEITCSADCEHSCNTNCVHSCSEECGGCSNLCYSCVGMCIGVCSVKCENGCSNCTNTCGWWCDSRCNQLCFANCNDRCIRNCSGSCATYLMSDTLNTNGPERPPTSGGYKYPMPQNRWEERELFIITRDIDPYRKPEPEVPHPKVFITFDDDRNLIVECTGGLTYVTYSTSLIAGVFTINSETGEISIVEGMLNGVSDAFEMEGKEPVVNDYKFNAINPVNHPNIDGGGGMFIVVIKYNPEVPITDSDVLIKLPFGFEALPSIRDKDNNMCIIIQRHIFDEWTEEEG